MGRFQNLSQVGLVLVSVIEGAVPANTEVRLNVPIEDPAAAAAAVRVTLLWTTPQPSHRNDADERNLDGSMALPPPTLTAWYVVSTYGATDDQNAVGAHDLLGQIIREFHRRRSRLDLPIDLMGEGAVHVVQVPLDPELSEKIWVPLQVRQRPWALFEVAPVQLIRPEPPQPPPAVVHPEGLRFAGIEAAPPPHIERITPSVVGRGGRVRIDGTYTGAPARVSVGTNPPIVPPAIAAMATGGPVSVTLPAAIVEGTYDVRLTGALTTASEPHTIRIVDPATPSVDAPAVLGHSRANPLILEGRALGVGAVTVVFWPDAGIAAPTDVVPVAGTAATTTIAIPAANLAPLGTITYRVSLQFGPHLYTPYVLLGITP